MMSATTETGWLGSRRSAVLASLTLAAAIALWWGGLSGAAIGAGCGMLGFTALSRLPSASAVLLLESATTDAPMLAAAAAAVLTSGGSERDIAGVMVALSSTRVQPSLMEAQAAIGVGTNPARVWRDLAIALPPLAPVLDVLIHAADRGVTAARALESLATILAVEARRARTAKLRRAGVQALIPLALFGLTAFVILTVVPLVAAYASTLSLW